MQEAPSKSHHGEVVEIESEDELDKILQEDKDSLIVLLGSLTWCRPCKTLAKPLQVRGVLCPFRALGLACQRMWAPENRPRNTLAGITAGEWLLTVLLGSGA